MIITCSVPAGTREEHFAQFMGTELARRSGCTCPIQMVGWEQVRQVRIDTECPLHELQRAAS